MNIWPFSTIRRLKQNEHNLQWLVRTAFWESSKDDPEWRERWLESDCRAQLVAWGVISGKDTYR